MSDLYSKQVELEEKMYDGGIKRFNERNEKKEKQGDGASTDWNKQLTKRFIEPLAEGLEYFCHEGETKKGRQSKVVSYLRTTDLKETAFVAIRQMFNAIAVRDTTSIQVLSQDIASKIEDQVRFSKLKKTDARTKKYLAKIEESLKKAASQSYKHKKNVWANAETKVGADKWRAWPMQDKLHLGSLIIKIACEVTELLHPVTEEYAPLFFIDEVDLSRGKIRKSSKVLGITGAYAEWVSEFISNTQAFHPEVGACVLKPRDWKTPFVGGFHTKEVASRNPLIKVRDRGFASEMTQSQMPSVYRAVNALQAVSWKVNTEVFDVLDEIMKRKLDLAIPSLHIELEPLNPLQGVEKYEGLKGAELKEAMSPKEYDGFITWKRKKKVWHDDERSRKSNVIDLARTRTIAEEYAEFDRFHFVYSLDSRGRVYSRSTGLSPQGRDIQKGLLRFADRKKLGKHGHYWFKIHGANVYGWDKLPFTDRITNVETDEFKEMCKTIAKDPIANREWIAADKPWQFLSWCFEYADYLQHIESGLKGSTFKTFIAAAMDGSCSGIQHYSCMLRDHIGGKSVNLMDSPTPQDIYADVATIVHKKVVIESHWVTGDELLFAQGWLALGIDRYLTKTPVMTLPYGSSRMTCRDSVGVHIDSLQSKENKNALAEERNPLLVHTFGDARWLAEGYMSSHIWDSIGEVVVAAREGMSFIRKLAKECAARNNSMTWTTPTGFIVNQAIYKTKEITVNTVLHGRIQFKVNVETAEIDPRKMQSSAPPNFIHSYDAAHLILAICEMLDRGITEIWVIHDDFGTYCSQTGHLHLALRISLVDMYQDNALEELWYEQCNRHQHWYDLDAHFPEMGELDLNDILKSTYIFS